MKIPPQSDTWLGFGLQDVMAAVGPHPELTWRLLDVLVACDDLSDPDRWQAVAYDSHTSEGTTLTWADMDLLAKTCEQVVEGTLTGFDGTHPVLQFRAGGRRHWIVWARDGQTLERLRYAFSGVEDYDERTPHW